MEFQPFNPFESVQVCTRKLPHWRQQGTTYFVTARLADALPGLVIENWRLKRDAWLRSQGLTSTGELERLSDELRHEYHREFTARFHELLDAGHGDCLLRDHITATPLLNKLAAGHGSEYHLDGWVIMPNHFHALVSPFPTRRLATILQRWKGASAREINQLAGRSGPLWQKESFDHIVRSEAQRDHFRRYIALNPEKAGLQRGFLLGFGEQVLPNKEAFLKGWELPQVQ